jgi:hypothetical protein
VTKRSAAAAPLVVEGIDVPPVDALDVDLAAPPL